MYETARKGTREEGGSISDMELGDTECAESSLIRGLEAGMQPNATDDLMCFRWKGGRECGKNRRK
jgi:GH24 family phage-related lysozyme (muramidase)